MGVPRRCAGTSANDRRPGIVGPGRAVVAAVGRAVALAGTAAVVGGRRSAAGGARSDARTGDLAHRHHQRQCHSEKASVLHASVPFFDTATSVVLRTGAPGATPGRGSGSEGVERQKSSQDPCRFQGIKFMSFFFNILECFWGTRRDLARPVCDTRSETLGWRRGLSLSASTSGLKCCEY